MILCIGPNDKLQVVTDAAPSVHVHVSGMDADGAGSVTTYRKNTLIAGVGTNDITATPTSGVTRNVKTINIRNTDVSSSVNVTVRHTDGTNVVELYKYPLLAGQTLQYIEGVGWNVVGAGVPQSVVIASTVAGLGPVYDGKRGRIRVLDGSGVGGRYEIMDLVYDAVMGRWVGDEIFYNALAAAMGTVNTTSVTGNWYFPSLQLYNAGLKLQVHMLANFSRSAPGGIPNCSVSCVPGGTQDNTNLSASASPVTTAAAGFYDSGWQDLNANVDTTKGIMAFGFRATGDFSGPATIAIGTQIRYRWAS